jgi:hypothetical protein
MSQNYPLVKGLKKISNINGRVIITRLLILLNLFAAGRRQISPTCAPSVNNRGARQQA